MGDTDSTPASPAEPSSSSGASTLSPAAAHPLRKLLSFGMTLAASLGTFGFFAIQGILLARILGVEQRGVFAAIVLFPQSLLYLGLLGAPELFAGYAARGLPNASLRRSAMRYGIASGLITAAVCILLDYLAIPAKMRFAIPLAFLCGLTMPLQHIRLAVQAVDHGQRQFSRYNKVRLAAAAAFPLLLCVGYVFGYRDLTSASILFVLAQALSLLLIQFGMTESWLGPVAVPVTTAMKEAKGLMGAWLSTELLERMDLVLVLVLIADEKTLGLYATAVPIASLLIIVPNAVGLYAFNRGARSDERLTPGDAWRYLGLGIVVQVICAAILAAALPWLVVWFYGEAFSPTVRFAWLLLPAGAFRGLLQACDSYLRARKKEVLGVKARAIAIPILLLFSTMTLPWLGTAAIPVGLSIAQLVCFLLLAAGVVADSQEMKATVA